VPINFSCKLNIQDLMLCGGSDAPIIPIGKVHSDYLRHLHYQLLLFHFDMNLKFFYACIEFTVLIIKKLLNAGLGGFVACRALSQRNSDPTRASRPWDVVSSYKLKNTKYFLAK